MSTVAKRLEKLITHTKGKQKGERILGAMSRVSEKLGVSHATIIHWMRGGEPSAASKVKLEKLFSDKEFSPAKKKSGPKEGTRWKMAKNREHVYAKVD